MTFRPHSAPTPNTSTNKQGRQQHPRPNSPELNFLIHSFTARQEFTAISGMANIVAREGAVMHGVAHRVTQQMFDTLAKIESIYDYTNLTVHPYTAATASSPCAGASHGGDGVTSGGKERPPFTARAFIVPQESIAAQKAKMGAVGMNHMERPSERCVGCMCGWNSPL